MNRKPEKPDELKFYTSLLVLIYQDAAAQCGIRPSSIKKDCKTLRERCRLEGMGFLTKTLPTLGKCLDKALSSDSPISFEGCGFALSKKNPFPLFLQRYWRLVFDPDGLVHEHLSEFDTSVQVHAVRTIRQVCYLMYKLDGSCNKADEERVLEQFRVTDSSLPERDEEVILSPATKRALENAHMLLCCVLSDLNLKDIHPRHGPGAVATGEVHNEKMNFSRIYGGLEEVYPFVDYFKYNLSHLVDTLETLNDMEELCQGTAKITLVPKDSRGPRIISMEPLEMQWIQQGIMRKLYSYLESPYAGSNPNPCFGFVNFTDQEINRGLALENSHCGRYNTYDMSEASDRVSNWLVKKLFPAPIYRALNACRSSGTVLPDGHRLVLNKFAPMGSATCFPIEALTFWALAVGSLMDIRTSRDLRSLPDVYVYGDDIVAEPAHYEVFRPVFEELHLKFNEDKCCTGRFFKESCGMDAFKLESVNVVRIKTPWREIPSPTATASYVSYVNSLREAGYLTTADLLQSEVTKVFGSIPVTNEKSLTGLFFYSDESSASCRKELMSNWRSRWNTALQRTEIRIPVAVPLEIKKGDPDWAEMLRLWSLQGASKPFSFDMEEKALPCSYTVPRLIKTRWKWVGVEHLLASELLT